MEQILFVCAGNTCRSPIAQAIATELLEEKAEVESAGIEAASGIRAAKDAVLVMNERGLDITGHRSKDVNSLNLRDFDKIFAMTPAIARRLQDRDDLNHDKLEVLDILDPYDRGVDAYRTCADTIEDTLREFLHVQ
jgi:protein-tyrosine phosphatase